jgi:CelD/BcsL family acetyltransferase involved in cellulose biosynthesis
MEFTLHNNFDDNGSLPTDWNNLLEESVTHVPFLRHEYLRTWWQTRGGGEWPGSELAIIAAHQDGHLIGVAPLFVSWNHDGQQALLLLGSIEISDYLDLIVRQDDLSSFISGLLSFLVSSDISTPAIHDGKVNTGSWEVLDWQNIPESSPTLGQLRAEAEKRGWSFIQEQTYHAPYIPLVGDYETYLASIDKKQRHEIRRKMRRAEEDERKVQWYIVSDSSTLEAEVDAFLKLMAEEPEKAEFLTQTMRHQMHLTCQVAFKFGWLQLAFLEVDGKKAAGYLNFDYMNRIWVYNSGIARQFQELSPGWVLLGYLLKWANENKRTEFDFMRGNEDYKYRFGAVNNHLVRAKVTRY